MTRLVHSAFVAALVVAAGCTTYTNIVPGEDGKLLVTYTKGGLGFYSGGIYECTRKGRELACEELVMLLPTPGRAPAQPVVTEIVVDVNNLTGTGQAVRAWIGRTIAVHVRDGNLLTGVLTEVRGDGSEQLLVLTTDKGPLAVRLSDSVRITAMARAK